MGCVCERRTSLSHPFSEPNVGGEGSKDSRPGQKRQLSLWGALPVWRGGPLIPDPWAMIGVGGAWRLEVMVGTPFSHGSRPDQMKDVSTRRSGPRPAAFTQIPSQKGHPKRPARTGRLTSPGPLPVTQAPRRGRSGAERWKPADTARLRGHSPPRPPGSREFRPRPSPLGRRARTFGFLPSRVSRHGHPTMNRWNYNHTRPLLQHKTQRPKEKPVLLEDIPKMQHL